MEARKRVPATYPDVENLPPNLVGEIVDGDLYASARPAAPHTGTTAVLGMCLGNPFHRGRGGPGGWWIVDEPELAIESDIVVPDLAGWRRERMPVFPKEAQFTLVPDWICEVVSPATARLDRALKVPRYARWGVGHLWLVDPLLRTLEVYRNLEGRWLHLGVWSDDDECGAEPFEAAPFRLGELWVG